MESALFSQLIYLARSVSVALLFVTAGAILAVNRPQWMGSWLLLGGAILSSSLAAIRLLGLVEPTSGIVAQLAFEACETVSYVLAGSGILCVSVKARTISDEPLAANQVNGQAGGSTSPL